ncbi:MAG: Resolvase domain protein [Conexibacter sp.]|nr:Resolvase domain protein [Conexibacter sp.]
MESGTKIIGLIRVSTADQGRTGNGLEAQRAAIAAECDRKGWLLVDVIEEAAVSGRSSDRPGLTEALERIGGGEAGGLIVAKLDRLSRSVVDFGRILAWLEDADAHLVALDLGVDTSTPAGRLVANVLASVAQWEAETISVRTVDGLAAKRARGEQIGREAVPADVADRIRAMRADGLTMRAVCDVLNAEGVPTARGAASWSVSAVQTATGYKRPKRSRSADLPAAPKRRQGGRR